MPDDYQQIGGQVNITCPKPSRFNPDPTISWQVDGGKPLPQDPRYTVKGWSLVISGLKQQDARNYTCVVANIAGVRKQTMKLTVYGESSNIFFPINYDSTYHIRVHVVLQRKITQMDYTTWSLRNVCAWIVIIFERVTTYSLKIRDLLYFVSIINSKHNRMQWIQRSIQTRFKFILYQFHLCQKLIEKGAKKHSAVLELCSFISFLVSFSNSIYMIFHHANVHLKLW